MVKGKKKTAAGPGAAANTVKAAATAAANSSTQPTTLGQPRSPEGRTSPKAGSGARGGDGGKGAASRSREEEEKQEEEEEENEDSWLDQLRDDLAKKTGITPEQLTGVMELVVAAVKVRIGKEAEKAAKTAVVAERVQSREEKADRKSSRSVLIHRADLWVKQDNRTQGFGLAERVTAAVLKATDGIVQVRDAFLLGRWNATNPPTTVMVEFGSMAQKATFYRAVAKATQSGTEAGRQMQGTSCRDAFPKKYIADAQRLIQQGKALRSNGKIAAFRVTAQGPGCIPVLQVRHMGDGGLRSRKWETWIGPPPPPPKEGRWGSGQREEQGSLPQGSPTQQQRDIPWTGQGRGGRVSPVQKEANGNGKVNSASLSDTPSFHDAF